MLDSICLRVHNLQKNDVFIDSIIRMDSGLKVSESVIRKSDHETFLKVKYLDFLHEQKNLVMYKGTFTEPSSNYNLTYFINVQNDYCEFNFSIPKFIYGHNIAQFIPHQNELMFNWVKYKMDNVREQVEPVYKRLIQFIEKFFNWIYPACFELGALSKKDIEIARLDFCFNQFFQSKQDALNYLQYQKRLKKNFTRENNKGAQTYETSIFYSTERYSVKIYHKGTEYKKKDRKEHEKINKQMSLSHLPKIFNVQVLQDVSDTILRYELTTRRTFMSYLYRHNIFLKNDLLWKSFEKNYLLLKSIDQRIETAIKKNDEVKISLLTKKKYQLPKYVTHSANVYEKVMNTDVKFFIAIDRQDLLTNQNFDNAIDINSKNHVVCNRVKFDFNIFVLLYKKFIEFFNDFQIKEKVHLNDFTNRIKAYNTKQKFIKDNDKTSQAKKINASGLNQFVLLMETYTMDEIRQMKICSDRTFFYYKSKLKKLDVLKQNLMDYEIKKCDDFSHYNNWHFHTDFKHLPKNSFFI